MQNPQPLRDRLVTLAGTPDDDLPVDGDLTAVARLAADRVAAVTYASVTGKYPDGYATVAATSTFAAAVDQAQYEDGAGPCLAAVDNGRPRAVPEITATTRWPGFRATASGLGLHASLSIPLFTARGLPIAALNLYSRRPDALRNLSRAVESVFGGKHPVRVRKPPGIVGVAHAVGLGANPVRRLTGTSTPSWR